jgi:hypothetical protein
MLTKYLLVLRSTLNNYFQGDFFDQKITVICVKKGQWQARIVYLCPYDNKEKIVETPLLKKDQSISALTKLKGVPSAIGFTDKLSTNLCLADIYDIDVVWGNSTGQPKRRKRSSSKWSLHLGCPGRSNIPECDKSGACAFCRTGGRSDLYSG